MTSADSARYEGDAWDLASSVGVTATLVATVRAMATKADRPLINDPFAEPLVQSVGVDVLAGLATGELAAVDLDTDRVGSGMQRMIDGIAVRTKIFDEFFLDATQSGIRQ